MQNKGAVQLLTHEYPPCVGGIGTYVAETARALARDGHRVRVWAPAYEGPTGPQVADGFVVERLRMRGKQDWLCRWRLARALRARFVAASAAADVAVSRSEAAIGTVILAEPGPIRMWMEADWWRLPKPQQLILILHGSELARMGQRPAFRRLLHHADRIGVVSSAVERSLLQLEAGLAVKTVHIPGAVRSAWADLPLATNVSAPQAATGASLASQARVLLQVGRVHPRKGQAVFLRALALLAEQLPAPLCAGQLRAVLIGPVGKPAYAREVRQLIARSPIAVEWRTDVDDAGLAAAYAAAEVVVFPSCAYADSVEGLGLAILEAAHFGRPVIASAIGGTADALQDGQTGLLVPPANPLALATALRRLLAEPRMGLRLGLNGAAFVRQQFSWQRNAARLLEALPVQQL